MSEELESVEGPAEGGSAETGSAALSLALGRAGKSSHALDEDARAFLKKQGRLIDLQTEHLHEQREIVLSRLRWGRFSDRLKALLQVMTACVGLLVAAGFVWMAWSASQERGLVIEPFSVPPDLAARGITGQVIASKMLDRLGEMQAATNSARAASTYANNWNDDIKVEIPDTGVSIGELQRLMVSWLGRQTRITGELYRTPTGIALSARSGAAPAQSHEGAEADLDALIQQAAEDLYRQTQPYRYAAWATRGQDPQSAERSRQMMRDLVARSRGLDRVWAYNGLGVAMRAQGDIPGAIRALSAGIALEPRFPTLYGNIGQAEIDRGHNEAALARMKAAAALGRRYGRLFMTPEARDWYPMLWQGIADEELGDFAGAARAIEPAQSTVFAPFSGHATLIQAQALGHDPAAAEASFALFATPRTDGSIRAAVDRWWIARARESIALDAEDWRGLVQAYASVDPTGLPPASQRQRQSSEDPLAALAMARLGDVQGAEALIATTPLDCYPCLRARGRIAAMAHDWPAAERWFAEAVRQGPSLPFAEADWGRALLDRGDAAGAIAKLAVARAKGPHFADAAELWGEALMARRDWAGAAGKFAEADKDAPKWGRNHLMWGQALMLAGRYAEARAQYQAADGLVLSKADRAALNVLLSRTAKGPLRG